MGLRYYVPVQLEGNKRGYVLGNRVDIIEERNQNQVALYLGGSSIIVQEDPEELALIVDEAVRDYLG